MDLLPVPRSLGRLMYIPRQQRTIEKSATVEGFGYWSGKDVRVEFRPAAPTQAWFSSCADLPKPQRIAATVAQRVETPRRTTLTRGRRQRRDGRTHHGGIGRPAHRQLRSARQHGRNAGLRRFEPAVRRALSAAGTVTQNALARGAGRARGDAPGRHRQLDRSPPLGGAGHVDQVSHRLRIRQRHRPPDTDHADHARLVSPRVGRPAARSCSRARPIG